MTRPTMYPPAKQVLNGQTGGSFIGTPYRGVLHSTETKALPDYRNAPHITYDPRSRQFYQHILFDRAARALRNLSGGSQTNRANSLQIEIIAYSDQTTAESVDGLWIGDLTDDQLGDLREFKEWICIEFDVLNEWPEKQALSYSEANTPGFRMTSTEWDDFNGWCGHQHADENAHWDPGAFDWETFMDNAYERPTDIENPYTVKGDVVSSLDCPTGGGWSLGRDGAIYTCGTAPYLGGANNKDYFGGSGRYATGLELRDDGGYDILSQWYDPAEPEKDRYEYQRD